MKSNIIIYFVDTFAVCGIAAILILIILRKKAEREIVELQFLEK